MSRPFKPSTLHWWIYASYCVVVLPFMAPALISMADTFGVMLGVLLLVLLGVWSWGLWIKRLVHYLEDYIED